MARLPDALPEALAALTASDRPGRRASLLHDPRCWEEALEVLSRPSLWIVTGFFVPEAQAAETDGPPGACVLARALSRLGTSVRVFSDEACLGVLRETGAVLGLPPDWFRGFPFDVPEEDLRVFLRREAPGGLVYLERLGRTPEGVCRNMRGRDVSPWVAPLDLWALDAPSRGIPVAAVGDGGNEAGMGSLRERMAPLVGDFASALSCIPSDVPIPVDVSNWGGYALTAVLEASSGADLLHTPEEEREMLHAMKRAGGVDGTTCAPALSVDGVGMYDQVALVRELRALTRGPRG